MTVASTLFVLAGVAATSDRPDTGARSAGCRGGHCRVARFAHFPRDRPVLDRVLAVLTAALGPERLTAIREDGRHLPREQAVAAALTSVSATAKLEPCPAISAASAEAGGRNKAGFALTSREEEVLDLLTKRLTNAEIAERLVISPRTAGTHVANLLAKLGAANRRQAAAIAVRHGLI